VDRGVRLQLVLETFGTEEKLNVEIVITKKVLATSRESSFLIGIKQAESHSGLQMIPVTRRVTTDGSRHQLLPGKSGSLRSQSGPAVGKMTSSLAFSQVRHGDDPSWLIQLGLDEHWIIEEEKLRLEQSSILGSGGFGTVIEGVYSGVKVAVKIPKSERQVEFPLLNELRLLRHLRHPNIVLFFGACIGSKASDMMLVFELIHGVTLQEFMSEPSRLDRSMATGRLSILSGIACALQYLHTVSKPIVHSDLKDSNVFVETWGDHLRSKLGDFGLSRLVYKVESRMGGTLRWMAPEIITSNGSVSPAASADVFSFGRMMSMILSGVRPCKDYSRQEIIRATRDGRLPPLAWPRDTAETKRLGEFGKSCVAIDPLQRPTMQNATEQIAQCLEVVAARTSSANSMVAQDGEIGESRSSESLQECDQEKN